jgi:hypothetical protein
MTKLMRNGNQTMNVSVVEISTKAMNTMKLSIARPKNLTAIFARYRSFTSATFMEKIKNTDGTESAKRSEKNPKTAKANQTKSVDGLPRVFKSSSGCPTTQRYLAKRKIETMLARGANHHLLSFKNFRAALQVVSEID